MYDYQEFIFQCLGPGGQLEREISDFTFRQEQLKLAQKVAHSFEDESFVVAEVGTGVGKTFAYMIPAILWAVRQKKKVVISTRTKALQQQIIDRDLPDLSNILDISFKYAEAKGRDNFLCWNKYINILAGKVSLEPGQDLLIQAIVNWAEITKTGDRKELDISSDLMLHWPILAASRENCGRDLCKYHDKCFRLKMRKRLEKADIIIANHALLLSDIREVQSRIIPPYEFLIVDEAHTFIRECFDKLSFHLSLYRTLELLNFLYSREKRTKKGYLLSLQGRYAQLSPLINEARSLVDKAVELTREFFKFISKSIRLGDDYSFNHTIGESDKNRWFGWAFEIYKEWQDNFRILLDKLREIEKELDGQEDDSALLGIRESLTEISSTAFVIMEEAMHSTGKICWVEYDNGRAVEICSADIFTGNIVDQHLYQNLRALVMVSATLAVEDQFDNFISRSGLSQYCSDERLTTLLESSPFNYEEHACLYVIKDMPDPSSTQFNNEVNRVLKDILIDTGGCTMVLFTSRKQLQESSAYLRQHLYNEDLQLLVQYEDGNFGTLMDAFLTNPKSVLMGLETFWEGIDLKGECLKCLVIVKLPFRSPSDPYSCAWEKYYRTQRKGSFEHFMLPDAVVRFKQGVGRLIRSEDDRGAVVVLDTRIITKNYGRVVLNSIPIKNVIPINKGDLKEQIHKWVK